MKNFRNNPNMAFFDETKDDPTGEKMQSVSIPDGYVLVKQSRSRRMQILVSPSTYSHIKEIANVKGASANEIVNQALEQYIEAHISATGD